MFYWTSPSNSKLLSSGLLHTLIHKYKNMYFFVLNDYFYLEHIICIPITLYVSLRTSLRDLSIYKKIMTSLNWNFIDAYTLGK